MTERNFKRLGWLMLLVTVVYFGGHLLAWVIRTGGIP